MLDTKDQCNTGSVKNKVKVQVGIFQTDPDPVMTLTLAHKSDDWLNDASASAQKERPTTMLVLKKICTRTMCWQF